MMRYLVWDFDGTLGYRAGRWSSALLSVLESELPGQTFDADLMRTQLRTGFPWHTPGVPHPDLSSSDEWWNNLHPVFTRAFEAGGLETETARALAARVRKTYVDPRYWHLFDDTLPVLGDLSSRGWR